MGYCGCIRGIESLLNDATALVAHSKVRINDDEDNNFTEHIVVWQSLPHELLVATRKTLIRLRDSGIINGEVLRKIQYEIAMEEVRLSALPGSVVVLIFSESGA